MKKFVKILGAVIAIVLVLVVALVVLAKILITPERVKETVLPLAEKNLQRKIDLGDINVSLFSGIELRELKVYEANREDLFVSTELVRLKYQLLPLLSMRVVIDEVRVEKPRIRVVRLADGRFNFSDMIGAEAAQQSSAGKGAPEKPQAAADSSGTPISLLVSQVRLQGGSLQFFDHVLNDQAPYRFDIENLDVAADGITLTGAVPVKIKCVLNGSPLALSGTVNPMQPAGEFDINLAGLDVLAFKHYFEDAFPGRLGRMMLDVKTRVSGSPDSIAAVGEIVLSDLDFVLEAMPEAPFNQARVAVGHNLNVDLADEKLQLEQLAIDLNGLRLELKGVISGLFGTPLADLELSVPGLDLRQAMASVPSALVKDLKDLDPAGTVRLQATLQGDFEDPLRLLKGATIDLDNVQATAGGQRPSLGGRMTLTGDQVRSEKLQLRMGDNSAQIALTAKNLFGETIVATADLSSEKFILDALLADDAATLPTGSPPSEAAAKARPGTTEQKSQPVKADELGPFDLPVQASGSIRIGETVYKGLSITDFIAQYQLKNNVLTIDRMDGKVAGGTFRNKARVDLGQKGLVYNAEVGLTSIQADPLLSAFIPKAAGALLGAMNLDVAVSGRGTQWETLSRKLGGQGDVLVADGRLVQPQLVNGFATFLQIPDLKEIRFRNFEGAFKIVDGKLRLNGQLLSDHFKLQPKGVVGLDGSLDLALDTRLSPEVAGRLDQKGQVTRYLQDKEGWSQLPLLLSGTFDAPRFGLDPKAIQAQATKALTNELDKQIDKLFKKEAAAEPGEPGSPSAEEDPAQKMLKDSLKRLFGN